MDWLAFWNFWNWIDTVEGWLGDLAALARRRGGGVGIAFTSPPGLPGAGIERILKRYKIPVWGRRVTGHVKQADGSSWVAYSLRTEANRADWARYIIWRAGAQVDNDPNPHNATWAAQHTDLPPAWGDGPRPGQAERSGPQSCTSRNLQAKKRDPAKPWRDLW